MLLYSFSLLAEWIRTCLKFEWRFCGGHCSLPRFKNPNLMIFAQIPFFWPLQSTHYWVVFFSFRFYEPCYSHFPFAHFNLLFSPLCCLLEVLSLGLNCTFLRIVTFMASTISFMWLISQSPFRPQSSLDLHFAMSKTELGKYGVEY